MENLRESYANKQMIEQAQGALRRMLHEVLLHGVHGLVTLELLIVDGTIQRITRRVEQTER